MPAGCGGGGALLSFITAHHFHPLFHFFKMKKEGLAPPEAPRPPKRCWKVGITLVFGAFFILSVALLAMGTRLRGDASKATSVANFVPAACTLTSVSVMKCPSTSQWTAVWLRQETAGTAIQNPFAFRATRALAEADMNDYPLNVTMQCMCDPSIHDSFPFVNCESVNACLLDLSMVEYMKVAGTVYGYSGDALLANGALTLILAILGCIFFWWGAVRCCKPTTGDTNEFYGVV